MSEPVSKSEILSGEPSVSSTPPLILLQSEEDSGQPQGTGVTPHFSQVNEKELEVSSSGEPVCDIVVPGNSSIAIGESTHKENTSEPSGAFEPSANCDAQELPSSPTHDAWNLDHLLTEDKNPFSGLTEEHLSRLEDVLSSEEVRNFLQQTQLQELDSGLEADSVSLASVTSAASTSRSRVLDASAASDDALKLDLFETQTTSSLNIDEAFAHQIIQDSVREHELAVMAAAFSDHAYALPSAGNGTPSDSTSSSPRKSARIKQRMDDGKSAFESDVDFEYYLTSSRRSAKKDDQSEGEKTHSPASTSPASSPKVSKPSQPKRRSTRIVDMENREKAEKILQENRLKEQEAKQAMLKKMEEESKAEESQSQTEESAPKGQPLRRGKKMAKKRAQVGKKRKGKQATADAEDAAETRASTGPKGKRKNNREALVKGNNTEVDKKTTKKVTVALEKSDSEGTKEEQNSSEEVRKQKTKLPGNKQLLGKKKGASEQQQMSAKKKEDMVQLTVSRLKKKLSNVKKEMPDEQTEKQETEARESSDDENLPLQALAMSQKSQADDNGHNDMAGARQPKAAAGKQNTFQAAEKMKTPNQSEEKVAEGKVKHKQKSSRSTDVNTVKHTEVQNDSKSDGGKIHSQQRKSKGEEALRGNSAVTLEEKAKLASVKIEEVQQCPKPVKHKHRKSEEVIIDPSVTDLFKPDGIIPTDHVKKEGEAGEQSTADGKHGQNSKAGLGEVRSESVGKQLSRQSSVQHALSASLLQGSLQGFGDAGPDVKGVKQHIAVGAGVVHSKEHSHPDQPCLTKDTGSNINKSASTQNEQPQQIVYVSLKSEKGQVKIIHSQVEAAQETKHEQAAKFDVNSETTSLQQQEGEKREQKAQRRTFHKRKSTFAGEEGHDSGDLSYEDDEKDSDWEPSNDPDTLYCICKKPHGNRFMICCDKCQEWYHGQCVGVSHAQGRQMERDNKEYICPVCSGMISIREKLKLDPDKKEKVFATGDTPWKSAEAHNEKKQIKRKGIDKQKWMIQRCILGDCKRDARFGSVYCSNDCIIRHAQESLRLLRSDKQRISGNKGIDVRPSEVDRVMVMERRSGRVLTGPDAPTEAQLELWLQTHPTFEVMQPSVTSSASIYGKKDRRSSYSHGAAKKTEERRDSGTAMKIDEKEVGAAGSNKTGKPDEGPDQVRLNVRKTLREALAHRTEEADDIVLSSSEIKHLALSVEEELYKVFDNTGHKYRAKYRSLLFNIKDQKNKGLFRKILTGKIKPSKLVKMSTEELASRELAKWRQRETKHTLAMIEQTEKEAMKEGHQHIRKKTHKGEVELDDEDMSTLVTHVEEQKPKNDVKDEETVPAVIVDTTDQHRAHLFDLNCKICTGKMVPPSTEELAPKKVKVAHTVVEETRKKTSTKAKDKKVEIQAEEVVRSAMRQVRSQSSETTVSSVSSVSSASTPQVTVGSPDSALQSGLEAKPKFTPSGPMVWKGFISMQDFAKLFTSAYRVSGPVERLGLPDTLQICGRIGPEQMWDYLGKIRQAGSRDICILRFIPGSDDEKAAYVHLYSYLNSRGRCGVVGNAPKHVKDLYIVPLASHSKIPQVLLPFDGPGLESNRPHMLIGIIVRQKVKRPNELELPSKSSQNISTPSLAKKARGSTDQETEAYSPTADSDDLAGSEAVYIPTPTVVTHRSASSSSSSSTPSSSDRRPSAHHRHESGGFRPLVSAGAARLEEKDPIVKAFTSVPDKPADISNYAEPYSPGKEAEGDAPYDPEDDSQFDDVCATSSEPAVGVDAKSSSLNVTVGQQQVTASINPPKPAASVSGGSMNIDTFVEKIAGSSNPQEISSLMVAMLATAKDSTEQQQLLATLTSKVEEQKRKKAGQKLQEGSSFQTNLSAGSGGKVEQPITETAVISALQTHSPIMTAKPDMVTEPTPAAVSSTVTSTTAAAPQADLPGSVCVSRISSLTPDTQNMPLALKALMEDLRGNMQMTRAVDKRTERERREWEKKEAAKEAAEKEEQIGTASADKAGSASSTEALTEAIPGLGGAVDESNHINQDVDERDGNEAEVKSGEVSSSADSTEGVKVTQVTSSTGLEAELALSDTDLRQQPVTVESQLGLESLPLALDRDDRVGSHSSFLPLPPHPAVSLPPSGHPARPPSYPPHYAVPPSSHHLHLEPLIGPHPIDATDIDHRQCMLPPSVYPRPGMVPPSYTSRPPVQPPPPGTEVEDIPVSQKSLEVESTGDVDFRQQTLKRTGGQHSADMPHRKALRLDSVPPLPPLPPQPPPPLPPLPASSVGSAAAEQGVSAATLSSVCMGVDVGIDRLERSGSHGRLPSHADEHWHGGHDYDHRQHPHSSNHRSHFQQQHHHRRHHSPAQTHRHRQGHDTDSRRQRGSHSHRDRR